MITSGECQAAVMGLLDIGTERQGVVEKRTQLCKTIDTAFLKGTCLAHTVNSEMLPRFSVHCGNIHFFMVDYQLRLSSFLLRMLPQINTLYSGRWSLFQFSRCSGSLLILGVSCILIEQNTKLLKSIYAEL